MNENTTAASREEQIADTIFFLKDMVRFFNRQHAAAKRLIEAGQPFRAATPLGYAFDAERTARDLHDQLTALFDNGEMDIDDDAHEAFCESETLYRQATATEKVRKAACEAQRAAR